MKFSIIIPAYNAEKTIGQTIESILKQEYKDYEIIIVNDNSKDNTREVVLKYENVRLIDNKEQLKAGGSRNTGIDNAKGEYIIFLDSDDFLYNEKVLTKINSYIEEDNYDLIYLGLTKFVDGEYAESYIPTIEQEEKEERLKSWKYTNVWDICWNRKFIVDNEIRFVEKRYIAEDALFYYEGLVKAKKIKSTNIISHVHRRDSKSSSATTKITFEKMSDFYDMIAKTYKFAETVQEEYQKYILRGIRSEIDYASKLSKKLEDTII